MTKWIFTTLLGFSVVAVPHQALAQVDGRATKEPMTTARGSTPVTGVIGGQLYVVGGAAELVGTVGITLQVYDPIGDGRETEVPMSAPRLALAAGVIDRRIEYRQRWSG